jgi:hypothetical protein
MICKSWCSEWSHYPPIVFKNNPKGSVSCLTHERRPKNFITLQIPLKEGTLEVSEKFHYFADTTKRGDNRDVRKISLLCKYH